MINVANFSKAYKEVFVILEHLSEDEKGRINIEVLNLIQENMDKEYEFYYDQNVDIENQNLLDETKAILSYIFINFLANEKQKSLITQKYKKDIEECEKDKKIKYPYDNLFDNKKKDANEANTKSLVEYKKDNIFEKIKNRLKNLFKRKSK